MSGDVVLRVGKAAKFFGRKLVFKNVSCELKRGEILLLAGRNGAGKSTLMKIMAGLGRASAGKVELLVEPEKSAYLGHETFIYPGMTAAANLRFWAGMYGVGANERAVAAVLERVGLSRVAEEKAGGFSRGMSQRLNLARVFLVEPELVFLDEPGTGLDFRSLDMMRREIDAFRDRGTAVVWISHHVHEDRNIADKVLALGGRKVEYFGPAADYEPEGPTC
jgi:heme exporter protein A